MAYRKAAAQMPDAVWLRGRIFELEESLATQAAIKAAAISPDAKTYAMVIGISKYQKLAEGSLAPVPDADAKTFSHTSLARRRPHPTPTRCSSSPTNKPPRPRYATLFRLF